MKVLEKILKSVANKRRLEILKLLKHNKELSVGEIAEKINLSLKSTSRHLGVLFGADMIEKDQRSLQVFYRLAKIEKHFLKSILSEL